MDYIFITVYLISFKNFRVSFVTINLKIYIKIQIFKVKDIGLYMLHLDV